MAKKMSPWGSILLGAVAGAGVSLIVWKVIDYAIDTQLEQGGRQMLEQGGAALEQQLVDTLEREVPPRVDATIRSTLNEYNITPTTGEQIRKLLDAADRVGII